jgi:hypothetical protein
MTELAILCFHRSIEKFSEDGLELEQLAGVDKEAAGSTGDEKGLD